MSDLDLLAHARSLGPTLVDLRRDLHRHPELGFEEHRTAGVVAAHLRGLGLEPRTEVGITGVTADIVGTAGPMVAVRADMDALPIQEDATHEYSSNTDGVMHACGHDAHTAGLLGTAALLVAARDAGRLRGTVRLLFQPCEEKIDAEGKSGATRMLEDGALEGVHAVTGLHVGSNLPLGKMFVAPGPIMGGTAEVVVEVLGRAAHAAFPHEGIDAVVLAAQGIQAVQTAVSRRIAPMSQGVVSFGTIHGGAAPNVLAERVRLHGTLRYFDDAVRETLEQVIRGAFESVRSLGGDARIEIHPGYPPVVNDASATAAVSAALQTEFGDDAVLPMPPILAAEDFAFLGRAVPGVFFWLGAALPEPRQHHHPRFDIDEAVLPVGASALARAALALLEHCSST